MLQLLFELPRSATDANDEVLLMLGSWERVGLVPLAYSLQW